ncbi:AcrR family transcriptional regulator [Wenyingzhuangia heitensis]|uniref:AcrR family transcriptional regulator n=1 Tax=Wenyingzhuangia heitensis TaxID=1487859 RepID=A0ABX0UAF4_9FLAO|nr:TetR/AcrR family transcriptional regulator [Wenyingzhuangia heitensis]NIJ44930.1 AcrR family transcriptional regulator [Wenyingzhuangia heitensis]
MRPQKVNDVELLSRLMSVIRSKGYDGASLNDLAAVSGLKKASLYHRFPGGKKDIVLAVLGYVDDWFVKHIQEIVYAKDISKEDKLSRVLNSINELYACGLESCIVGALTLGGGISLFTNELKTGIESWLDCFSKIGTDFGYDKEESNQKAIQVLVKIQGSLIVSKACGSTHPFNESIKEIKELYIS